jgi:hypothetical protein
MSQKGNENNSLKGEAEEGNGCGGEEVPVERTQQDVLCGRGVHILHHVGNLRLHLAVDKYKNEYPGARRKRKREIVLAIVAEIKASGSRFLKRSESGSKNQWIEISESAAYQKVSHALRDQHTGKSLRDQNAAIHASMRHPGFLSDLMPTPAVQVPFIAQVPQRMSQPTAVQATISTNPASFQSPLMLTSRPAIQTAFQSPVPNYMLSVLPPQAATVSTTIPTNHNFLLQQQQQHPIMVLRPQQMIEIGNQSAITAPVFTTPSPMENIGVLQNPHNNMVLMPQSLASLLLSQQQQPPLQRNAMELSQDNLVQITSSTIGAPDVTDYLHAPRSYLNPEVAVSSSNLNTDNNDSKPSQ